MVGLLFFVVAAAGCKSSGNGSGKTDAAMRDGGGGTKDGGGDGGRDAGADARDGGNSMCLGRADAAAGGKAIGETCSCASDCASGFCADGVCCNTSCGESCKTCNLPSSLGTCTFVPNGEVDLNGTCKKQEASTCGTDGTCDGKGACRAYEAGTECVHGRCDSDSVAGGYVCDGKSNCVAGPVTSCGPNYSCNRATDQCFTTCTSNSDCAAGRQCVNGSCGPLSLGSACKTASQCASGFCADGYCCNSACKDACYSCDQTGYVGRCRLIDAGRMDPDCKAEAPSTCGTTGRCDALGRCAKWPATSTVCISSSCSGNILNTQATCDGLGTCGSQGVQPCSPFLCTNGACTTSCTTDIECDKGHPCKPAQVNGMTIGQCSGLLGPGAACSDAKQCDSGFCVDKVCCKTSCTGGCRSCALPGVQGTCTNVAQGAADPRGTCNDNGAQSCDLDGKCDGNGACEKYPASTTCKAETCVNGVNTKTSTCSSAHQCVAGTSSSCAPYVCNGTTSCFNRCTNNNQCLAPNTCVNGSCGLKDPGADCSADSECKAGHCEQGVCCATACTGACTSCNLPGNEGKCSPVASGPDPHGLCVASAASTCGNTGQCKAGACAKWDAGQVCKAASCTNNNTVAVPASTCNGAGVCVSPANVSCGAFICSGNACKNTCASNSDCVSPNICDTSKSSCGPKANGQSCSTDAECGSGICTEKVCCNSRCSEATTGTMGLCSSCKVTGKVGSCSPVPAGGSDPSNRCVAKDPLTGDCSNNGTCNGAGSCAPTANGLSCSTQSCTSGVQKNAGTCTNGTCTKAADLACSPYVCSATSPSCLTRCTKDADCVGVTCNLTTNRCGDKLGPGETCTVSTDCGTGVCSEEKVCCDTACTAASAGCSSCVNGTGGAGKCSALAGGSTPRSTTTCPASLPCGNTGKCDGAGTCAKGAAGTSCGLAGCTTDHTKSVPAATCNGSGTCTAGTPTTCDAGYLCDDAMMTCNTSCTVATAATDCAPNYTCVVTTGTTGTCQKKAAGTTCSSGVECTSGNCVDGVCCTSTAAACGTCMACNLNNPMSGMKDGICRAVADGATDSGCTASAASTCGNDGTCNGAGACAKWPSTTQCRAASCSGSKTQVSAANCNGSGTCPTMVATPCAAGYLCVGTACAVSCSSDLACDTAAGYTCDLGTQTCTMGGGTGGTGGGGAGGTGGAGTGGVSTGGVATGGTSTGGISTGGTGTSGGAGGDPMAQKPGKGKDGGTGPNSGG